MKEIAGRLRKIRKELDLTQQQFCEKIGVTRGSFSRYESGLRSLPDEIKGKLLQFDINLHWLITGKGPMFINDECTNKTPIIENNVDKLQHYIELGKSKVEQEGPKATYGSDPSAYVNLPIVGEIAAGNPMEITGSDLLGNILVSSEIVSEINNFFCFRVNGWSMSPEVQHGDVVIINKLCNWDDQDNSIVAVRIDGGVTLKIFKIDHNNECSWLMPINHDFTPILLNEHNRNAELLGVMEYLIRSYK